MTELEWRDEIRAEISAVKATVHKRLHPGWYTFGLALALAIGSAVRPLMDFFAVKINGPGLTIESLDRRVGILEVESAQWRELVGGFIASGCLDSAQAERLRRSLVPCARLLRERGTIP